MKSKKIFVSLTLVFSMIVMLLPYNANACVMTKNTEGLNDSSDNSDAVLAYYDVKTQKETLFTEKDLQDTISRAKKVRNVGTQTEPKEATVPQTIQKMAEEEMRQFEEARQNTIEYYGETANNLRVVDNRTLVSNPQGGPYYSLAKLFYTKKTNAAGTTSSSYIASGFAVGKNLCATARHCLTDNYGNWASDFKAYYGYDRGTYCDLLTNVSAYIYYPQYITGKNADGTIEVDSNYDIAFVVWGERTVEETGCLGMSSEISNGMNLISAGYPGDLDGGERMYQSIGNVTSFTNLRMNCDNIYCHPGQSGSAYYDTDLFAHGVMTHTRVSGTGEVIGDSSGRRFDSTLIEWLISGGYV